MFAIISSLATTAMGESQGRASQTNLRGNTYCDRIFGYGSAQAAQRNARMERVYGCGENYDAALRVVGEVYQERGGTCPESR
jgi:hypothetical protein